MHTKFERFLSKSLTTLKVVTYYLVVHTGPGLQEVKVGGLETATSKGLAEKLEDNRHHKGVAQ